MGFLKPVKRWILHAPVGFWYLVMPRSMIQSASAMTSSHFDAQAYKTVLQLAGASGPVEIEL